MRQEPDRLLLAPNSCVLVNLVGPQGDGGSGTDDGESAPLLRCASVLSVPTLVVIGAEPIQENEAAAVEHPQGSIVLDRSPDPWQHSEFSERIQTLRRDQLLVLGSLLDPSVTFAALGALRLAIDVFLIANAEAATPELELAQSRLTRLRQYGIVSIDVTQAVVELAVASDGQDAVGSTEAILQRFGLRR